MRWLMWLRLYYNIRSIGKNNYFLKFIQFILNYNKLCFKPTKQEVKSWVYVAGGISIVFVLGIVAGIYIRYRTKNDTGY